MRASCYGVVWSMPVCTAAICRCWRMHFSLLFSTPEDFSFSSYKRCSTS